MAKIPFGIILLPRITSGSRDLIYRLFIIIFTFLCYASYHLSRKPISVVKSVFHRNCSTFIRPLDVTGDNETWCDWAPFDTDNYEQLLGTLDYAFLFSYAICMFISGHIAERVNLRYFLAIGMVGTGFATALFGLGYFWKIHSLYYYVIVQIVAGGLQSTGWPSVVACMGNWYGKGKRGLIMGIWNSHTSVGNILGSVIPGVFVDHSWGWSFIVPGIIIGSLGVLVFFFLVPRPEDVGCSLPDHQGTSVVSKNVEVTVEIERPIANEARNDRDDQPLLRKKPDDKAISLFGAMKIPGVLEFALCLFFAKLVSYTFLFWLPKYINSKNHSSAQQSADLSTFFDVGGIVGGIVAGVVSDMTGARASTCVVMLFLAAPMMFVYDTFGSLSQAHTIGLLLVVGALVNGPYALITTAVSADLGTHKSLQGNARALATVTAFIDGTGSIGAAVGPLLTGLISPSGWNNVFYMLIAADIIALFMLTRLFIKEAIYPLIRSRRSQQAEPEGGDTRPFASITTLEKRPAHLGIFLHYLILNSDPSCLFFYVVADMYSHAQGSIKDLRKWAYEIYSTFLVQKAPLKVELDSSIVTTIDCVLAQSAKENSMRSIFDQAKTAVKSDIAELLVDFCRKMDLGLGSIYGVHELDDVMDKNKEHKLIDKYLSPLLERCTKDNVKLRDRDQAIGWALATFLRYVGVTKIPSIDRTQSFVMKDKRVIKLPGKSNKTKQFRGHVFNLTHYTTTTFCTKCSGLIWGVGTQGFNCQVCDINVHRQCSEDVEQCGGKQKKDKKRPMSVIPTVPTFGGRKQSNPRDSGQELIKDIPGDVKPELNINIQPAKRDDEPDYYADSIVYKGSYLPADKVVEKSTSGT